MYMKGAVLILFFILLPSTDSIRRYHGKDDNIDVKFLAEMMDAYLCSGDQDWAERLNDGRTEHFMLYQFFQILAMQWCRGHNQENIVNVIEVSKYKDWFESQGENKRKITDCVEGGLRYALLLAVCCKNFSAELLDSTYYLICDGKAEDTFCKFINITIKSGRDANFFGVIGRSAICQGNCPFDLEIEHVRSLRTTNVKFHRQNKRQFDLASTFDSIGQFICSDMEERSTLDAWNPIVTSHLAKKHEAIDENKFEKEFLYMFVFRKPACCLLDRRSYD